MNSRMLGWVICAALGSGLVGGVFFAFSTFVMQALGRLPPPQGIAAMQALNVTAVTPLFMLALIGTTLVCLILGVAALAHWRQPGMPLVCLGCALYLLGAFGVTVIANVPLNDALAAVDPHSAQGAEFWRTYLTQWTVWNHVRTLTSLMASGALIAGLFLRANP